MGIDQLDLVMRVEDKFDIEIRLEDYGELRTVGDLFEYLDQIKHFGNDQSCTNISAFCSIRRTLMRQLGSPRSAIRPRTAVDSLIPRRDRKHEWKNLARSLDIELPPLERSIWVLAGLGLAATVALFAGYVVFSSEIVTHQPMSAALIAVSLVVALVLAESLSKSIAVNLPHDCATVGDIVHHTLTKRVMGTSARDSSMSRSEAWELLRAIICEQLLVPPSAVTRQARFIEDLGMS